VGSFGEVQVMDWGLADFIRPRWPRDENASDEGPTVAGEQAPEVKCVYGTPGFMPPEQARGENDWLDQRADVFGLGGILVVILTGQPPFEGQTTERICDLTRAGDFREVRKRLASSGADHE